MSHIKELKGERKQLFNEMSRIKSAMDNGSITTYQRQRFAELDRRIMAIDTQIAQARVGNYDLPSGKRTQEDERFTTYLRGKAAQPEYRASADTNALSTAPNSAGVAAGATGYNAGYMIPQGFWTNLQVALKAFGGLSNSYKFVQTATGAPMPWPTVNPTAIIGSYITEANQLGFGGDSQGGDYQFGQGMLNAWTIVSGVILASIQLVQDSAFDVDAFVSERIGEAIGRKLAQEAVSGTGASACLGIIPALNAKGAWSAGQSGGYINLTAAQSVNTFGGASTELILGCPGPQTILNLIAAVDPAYRNDVNGNPTAKFFVNDTQLKGLRSITDNYGRPLLVDPSDGRPPTLYGYPVIVDQNLPNLTASVVGGMVFGDLSRAMVFRVVRDDARVITDLHPTVMRLTERYADYLQIGYLGYLRADMRSNDMRAAATVKPAAT